MLEAIGSYLAENGESYWGYVGQHLLLSSQALFLAILIGLPLGYLSYKNQTIKQIAVLLTQGLRVIPSLGVLFILIPLIGVGHFPALIALLILALPPILLHTIVGFSEVSASLIETGLGMGMTKRQLLGKVTFPLALPHVLNGIKLALIEIIASATLATYIGAGGLGTLIFTGLGLYRYDLLLLGGGSVAALSFISMLIFDGLIKHLSSQGRPSREKEKMKKRKLILGGALAIILMGLVGFIWTGLNSRSRFKTADTAIRVGSKDFTENLIVAEIYALALENNGYHVERKSNISSSLVHNAILNKEIDLYPEYTGTGLLSILKEKMETDPNKVYEIVKSGYEREFNLTWLDYAAANDSQGLVIRTQLAEKLGIETISDLQKHANQVRFASQGEFDQREDGLPGLEKVYGTFDWKSTKVYDNSLKYSLLENDEADVTPAYTTEGQLVNRQQFTLLEDDKAFWPPYNLAPVVRNEILEENPEMAALLNQVSKNLNTQTVTQLNAKVDVEGEDYRAVAEEYYEKIKDK
ncbi:proline/glycine betaine ABC transport system,periplasmic component [Streptococcus varani]|uniref:Proline/glycine betaine ABC transport system,periplasmic component n=2 Tax=Streptococcus varani TaxID=1608583 RepID=A0A0E4CTI0_9STRE|nr:proline/glycine betaine ABC transport system,periplasmic component [Streptococcus varani]